MSNYTSILNNHAKPTNKKRKILFCMLNGWKTILSDNVPKKKTTKGMIKTNSNVNYWKSIIHLVHNLQVLMNNVPIDRVRQRDEEKKCDCLTDFLHLIEELNRKTKDSQNMFKLFKWITSTAATEKLIQNRSETSKMVLLYVVSITHPFSRLSFCRLL